MEFSEKFKNIGNSAFTINLHLFPVLILLFVCTNRETFAQRIDSDTLKTQLIFTDNEGFITKEDGMAFLVSHSLIDTVSSSSKKEWDKIKPTDTIGRYYRIPYSINYMMCLPYSLDVMNAISLIIEITSHGEIIRSEKFESQNKKKSGYKSFDKWAGSFKFSAYRGCFQHNYEDLYLFKELLPQDSIDYIRGHEYKYFYKHNPLRSKKTATKYCISQMQIFENKISVNYNLYQRNDKDKNGYTIYNSRHPNYHFRHVKKFTVKYFYENKKWKTKDTKKLKKIERFMKIKPQQYFL